MCCLCVNGSVCVWVSVSPLATTRCHSGSVFHTAMSWYWCVRVCYRCSDAQKGWFHLTRNDDCRREWFASTMQKFTETFVYSLSSLFSRRHINVPRGLLLCFVLHNLINILFLSFFSCDSRVWNDIYFGAPHKTNHIFHAILLLIVWMEKTESNNENASVAQIITFCFHSRNV